VVGFAAYVRRLLGDHLLERAVALALAVFSATDGLFTARKIASSS